MRLQLAATAFAVAFGASASAATLDFATAAIGNEGAISDITLDGVYVQTSGFVTSGDTEDASSGNVTDAFAYLDGLSSGRPAGLGVCQVTTSGDQCTPSSDDNVTGSGPGGPNEILVLQFENPFVFDNLIFRDEHHYLYDSGSSQFGAGDFLWITLDGITWATFDLAVSAITGADLIASALGTNISNAIAFGYGNEQFYLSSIDASPVPVPASALLFGTALLGMAGLRRRKSKA